MPTTMQLLDRALKHQSAARWADALDIADSTLTQAKKRGRLSPTLAGAIASQLGDDPKDWITIAAMEAEPATPLRETLLKRIATKVQKL